MADVNVFVAARGNEFMTEIAGWITEAAAQTGRRARIVHDGLPRPDGSINLVVAPHEFFELHDASRSDLQQAAAASVCVNTEQPGTTWFRLAVDACRRTLLSLDISDLGADAMRHAGVTIERLRLGGVPSIDHLDNGNERPIDVLFMGGLDDRRGAVLADLAPHLWMRTADIRLVAGDRPISSTTPQAVFGEAKQSLLASAKLVLNIHRGRRSDEDHPPYFEWARAVEAIAYGCVLISEPSEGCAPLVGGEHFAESTVDEIADTIDTLLADPGRRETMSKTARDLVFGELALVDSLGPLLDRIETDVLSRLAGHARNRVVRSSPWRFGATRGPHPVRLGPFRPFLPALSAAKQLAMEENDFQRRLDAVACRLAHGEPQHVTRHESPSFATADPEVTVVVSLYNYADVVTETLTSIAASESVNFEIVAVEDHATDSSRTVVREFIDDHPDVPMVLIAKDANEGLAAARNTGFEVARAALVMVMDADNMIYPSCLRKLADALHANPDVDAAYAILEDFGEQRGVRSAIAWDVERLCRANYIDAQSMLRKAMWRRLGGYRADDEYVYGWEDWDLWLRLAEDGGQAKLVTQILGRYRVQRGSMIGLTNLATDDAIAAMRARHPNLPWPSPLT